jgi:hypothetical protein
MRGGGSIDCSITTLLHALPRRRRISSTNYLQANYLLSETESPGRSLHRHRSFNSVLPRWLSPQVGIDLVRYPYRIRTSRLRVSTTYDYLGPASHGPSWEQSQMPTRSRALACYGGRATQPRANIPESKVQCVRRAHLDHNVGAHYTSTHSSYKLVYSPS